MDSAVWGTVACVRGRAVVGRIVVCFEVKVAERGGLVVETVAAKVSSSVRSDLSVTVAAVVVKTSVISCGTSVRESSVLPLTAGGAVVKAKSTTSSSVLDTASSPSVLSWFKVLKLCTSVEASVDE